MLDLAVTPDGRQLVAVGRGEIGIGPTTHSRRGSVPGSRSDTPSSSSSPSVMPKHEKRISVFNIADQKLELYVTPAD